MVKNQSNYGFKGNAHVSEIRALQYVIYVCIYIFNNMLILFKMVIVTFKIYQFCYCVLLLPLLLWEKFGMASLILFQKTQEDREHLYVSSFFCCAVILTKSTGWISFSLAREYILHICSLALTVLSCDLRIFLLVGRFFFG